MIDTTDSPATSGFNRRSFIAGAAGTAVSPLVAKAAAPVSGTIPLQDPSMPVDVTLHINGNSKSLKIDPRTTVLDALREHVGLAGTKKGCDHGQCGACTVLIDGRRVVSCLTLALAAQGQQILTIEGTPGQIMSAIACVKEGHANSNEDIREYMSGNICRCAAYPNIVAAVKQAAPTISSEQKG